MSIDINPNDYNLILFLFYFFFQMNVWDYSLLEAHVDCDRREWRTEVQEGNHLCDQ